jgi:hypothetical protein
MAAARVRDRMPGMLFARLKRRTRKPSWLACEHCGGAFVCPIEWEPADEESWRITCRCGSCGAWHEAQLTNTQAARWDGALDSHVWLIEHAIRRLDRERMAMEVDAFVAALRADMIGPADFCR